MKFKLDENLSPSLAEQFMAAGHDAHSVVAQGLGGANDPAILARCTLESRVLVTFDLDFANIQAYPPGAHAGIIILRTSSQAHASAVAAVGRALTLMARESPERALWIVEDTRVRIHEAIGPGS